MAKTSAPAACTHWMAASPTPPAPAWISTRSPGSRPVNSKDSAAETNALGTVASPVTEKPGGAGATSSSWVTIAAANAPKPSPTTGSPTETRETSEPTSRMRPHISRPRFPSGMKPSERNTSQKLSPAASTPTRTSRGASGGAGSGWTYGFSKIPSGSGASAHSGSSGSVRRSTSAPARTSRATRRAPRR